MGFIRNYLAELSNTLDKLPLYQIERLKDILLQAYRESKQVFIMGNGGSAATASHFACDLAKGTTIGNPYMRERFKVITLTDNVPLLTAWANDTDYENIFVEKLKNLLREGDVVIAISGSGNSKNVLKAVEYAKTKAAITIGLTGFEGGKLKDMVQECLVVPSNSMERIEDVHLILEHLLCSYLRELLRVKAIFLDRDGVICENRDDYVKSWKEFVWIPGSKKALMRLSSNGYITIVITNQSAVGRRIFSPQTVEEIHQRMEKEITQTGGKIEKIYYCPHKPEDGCTCRKPKPGLLLQAASDFELDFRSSYFIGDTITDIEMGHKVGCKTIMVKTGKGLTQLANRAHWKIKPDYIVLDLSEAVDLILKMDSAEK